jgi:hypothetical protein
VSVIRSAILLAPLADELLEQFAVFGLVRGEQSETERIVERVVDGAVLCSSLVPLIGLPLWLQASVVSLK